MTVSMEWRLYAKIGDPATVARTHYHLHAVSDPARSVPDLNAPEFRNSGRVRVRGAREHNLKNVDVDIPRDALVVFTGVSGSGKTSLAFGTLYAEAQRRYFDSVAPYARRLIDQAASRRSTRSRGCRRRSPCSSSAVPRPRAHSSAV
jgi:ABC-type glutathione transport system ATPase component